eukprot:scaffold884_cov398-Prasinococcus_capsulatus_cf.AAC.1
MAELQPSVRQDARPTRKEESAVLHCIQTTKRDWPEVPINCFDIYHSEMLGIASSDLTLRQDFPEILLNANATAWRTPQPHRNMCQVDALAVLDSQEWANAFAAQLRLCTKQGGE